MANRLNLDFSLETNEQRAAFLSLYINDPMFTKKPPTEEECEMMANYLLWGRNPQSGKNAVQDKDVSIPTKHGTWDHTEDEESLDALLEQPTFNEATVNALNSVPPLKKSREKFSRSNAIKLCTAAHNDKLLHQFQDLFTRIDELDYSINYYELSHNRRKEIRQTLLAKIPEERLLPLQEQTTHWSSYKYLKQRHYLKELYTEQYTMRDSLVTPILLQNTLPQINWPHTTTYDEDILVLPLGIKQKATGRIFKDFDDLNPRTYTQQDLQWVSDYIWSRHKKDATKFTLDFTDADCVYQLFLMYWELVDNNDPESFEGNLMDLIQTLDYYVEFAALSPLQQEILEMKKKGIKNEDIAFEINHKYKKSYTANYISTIFTQKIIPAINQAAEMHKEIVGNLFFEENFKTCSCCGRTYLLNAEYFVRKSRSKDGFTNKCKLCDKLERQERKVIELVHSNQKE